MLFFLRGHTFVRHVVVGHARVSCSSWRVRAFQTSSAQLSARQRYALVIDGDLFGPSAWSSMITTVSSKGHLVKTFLFAAPERAISKKWKRAISKHSVEFVAVPGEVGGTKDPGDIVLSMEAARLATASDVDVIAVAAYDADFQHMLWALRSWGQKVEIILTKAARTGTRAGELAEAANEVMHFRSAGGAASRQPKMKIVLEDEGHCNIQSITSADFRCMEEGSRDTAAMIDKLSSLSYLVGADSPLAPGAAKFYRANALGSLTVWPEPLMIEQFHAEVMQCERSWLTNPGDIVFVSPLVQSSRTKSRMAKYGNSACFQRVAGGGIRTLKDTPDLPMVFLRMLGYLDDLHNRDLGEAVDVFASMQVNKKQIRHAGQDIVPNMPEQEKYAILHSLLVSPKLHGTWQVAPKDDAVRDYLAKRGVIDHAGLADELVFDAMLVFSNQMGLPPRETYNGCVLNVLSYMNEGDTVRRR